ncbi:SigE family RNA polymerase sigma factor [Granulicoccus sp. GXG6511]|uniref:SigE family RNA polymerase sigma factor n=1 Tax=Granulicoccus sp. GXG6511 TaxID=3381351 RepID=UPI003D7E66AD
MSRAQRDAEFARFVAERSPRLLLLARHLCGDFQAAEDLTQSVLEKAYLKWGRVAQASDPYAYVRRMLINLNNDRLRRQPWRENPAEFVAEARTLFALPGGQVPADDMLQIIDRIALRRALAELTPRERSVIVLRYLEDLSEEATAAELGIRVGTVKSACHRALARLREHSEKVGEER